jgi:hypothetical protein
MSAAQDVRAFVRSRRRRTPSGVMDRYVSVFMLAMALAVLGKPVTEAVAGLGGQADPARAGAGLALVLAGLAGALALARSVGPVVLPGADAAWLVLSPLDRRAVLTRPARVLAIVALAAGGVLGLAALAALGAPDQLVWRLTGAMVLGMSASAGAMALAVLAQASQSWQLWLTAAVVALLVMAAVAAIGWARVPMAAAATAPPAGVAAVALGSVVGAGLLVRRAWGALGRIPAASLLTASTRAGHMGNAAVSMDPGGLTWIAEDNHWRSRRLRSVRWPSLPAPLALAWQDWLRTARRPWRLAAVFAAALLPAVLERAGGGAAAGVGVLAGALAVAATGVSGARRDGDNPGLARLAGVDRRAALLARALLPALLSGAWAATALICLSVAGGLAVAPMWLFGPLAAPALAAAALRMARRRPIDHSMPVLDTPAGAVPLGPVIWAFTGADLALLGCLPAAYALVAQPAGLAAPLAAQAVAGAAVLAGYVLRSR